MALPAPRGLRRDGRPLRRSPSEFRGPARIQHRAADAPLLPARRALRGAFPAAADRAPGAAGAIGLSAIRGLRAPPPDRPVGRHAARARRTAAGGSRAADGLSLPHGPGALTLSSAAEDRYAAERRQGKALAGDAASVAWGWHGPAGERRAERRTRFLRSEAALEPGVRCLELGAGTGEFTVRLAQSGCTLTALEISEATAARCAARAGEDVEVITGNAETGAGIEGRTFDAVVGVSVLHHLDLDASLSVLLDHLRPGGRFAFSEPNMANPQVWAERNIGWVARRRHVLEHETAFRRRALRSAFERGGLLVSTCETFDFLHPATPRALVPALERVQALVERSPLGALAGSIAIAGT
ncbi:MAG: class I SAM-dependent methyltransferase, partial [Thermoleophilaceae bacterium]|nr:class I SAM-dependent methyltransferase [Thermoleophilaceae bacterium]